MSLVGSLEDLGLGDILQIISLSRKSGVLMLRSEEGEGQILFREGRVTGAHCKGEPADLRSLVLASGAVSERELAEAVRASQGTDPGTGQGRQEPRGSLVAALRSLPALGGEALDELRRRHVERAVLRLFAWPSGEFSFDVRDDLDAVDPDLCVEVGIDAQYLAMEGARIRDEEDRDAEPSDEASAGDPLGFAELGRELRGEATEEGEAGGGLAAAPELAPEVEPGIEPGTKLEAAHHPAGGDELEAVAEPLEEDGDGLAAEPVAIGELEAEAATEAEADAAEAAEAPEASVLEASPEARFASAPAAPPVPEPVEASRSGVPVIAVDPDLPLLEWAKTALRRGYERIHIFQKTELAVARIRQYVVRGEVPVVVISDSAPPDPNSGAAGPAEIVGRLKALLPRMPVVALAGDLAAAGRWGADAAVAKPTPSDLHNPRRGPALREMGGHLLGAVSASTEPRAPGPGRRDPHALRRLREVSARLREAVARGGIIPVVLDFAAEHFARVALFLVRDRLAVGMAGAGLERAGGPDDTALRELSIGAGEPAWFRAVFESGAPVRGPARDPGDRKLVSLLGDREPAEAYVAPLESGERVIAVLYADNLPEDGALPDTHALEVILHEAGLALDRAALERQLAQLEGRDDGREEQSEPGPTGTDPG